MPLPDSREEDHEALRANGAIQCAHRYCQHDAQEEDAVVKVVLVPVLRRRGHRPHQEHRQPHGGVRLPLLQASGALDSEGSLAPRQTPQAAVRGDGQQAAL